MSGSHNATPGFGSLALAGDGSVCTLFVLWQCPRILASFIRYSHLYPICEVDMGNAAGTSDATARQGHLKLVVLGATGATGLEVVRHATERGHSVTAFVRVPDRLPVVKKQVVVKQGDLLDSSQLAQAIEGHDAVISTFGPRLPVSKADANLLQRFATALTRAMERTGVRHEAGPRNKHTFKRSLFVEHGKLDECNRDLS